MLRYRVIFLLLALSCSIGCASSRGGAAPDEQNAEVASEENTITSDELGASPATSIVDALKGRIPGVRVVETPGGGVSVIIRGVRALNGDTAPLYVVDDVPVSPGPDGELPGISLYDIESIRVLKDIAASARYGSRGMNGVILIETKRARGAEKEE